MHRRAGLGAIKSKNLAQAKFKDKGSELAETQILQLSKQLESFKGNLEEFASKHKDEIRKSPEFRVQFQEMCASIGVDPLASSKGFWSEMLGVGDFYYELGVKIVEVCIATSHRNGGLITLDEIRNKLIATSGKNKQDITIDDLLRAIKKLKALGNGFKVIPLDGRYLVQSVPGELSLDTTAVIQEAQDNSYVSAEELITTLKWTEERIHRVLDDMVKEGLVWVDDQNKDGSRLYWFPGLFSVTITSDKT